MSRRMTNLAKLATLIALPLLTSVALAQETLDAEDEAEEEIRRYTVEMIIFSYAQDVATGSEIFVADEPPLLEDLLEELPEVEVLAETDLEAYPETDSEAFSVALINPSCRKRRV